ncbi:uncharacterized protein OCT59_010703 [Rhizophagus irregularis]|uniref:Kinase-like domain-containing protein n=1 Tax=Rhizophagus irregularis (strain DAOM 181602 / DAOM 197198 / MUCL 43194) TaxID=747089 RepID=U9UV89_RHIID|nr:kinase-like domain-containing protein [Rhizophagus irregularis DAOM 181602=DAOM 197198]POG82652.1 kinase-like domain-containing protein [Rhizophagus irregularis DAOM 181602=DAOM 197198]UZO19407.1 hypothetical protein OCT59_010703 [Rhizophagus irregularis]GBC13145.1 kinase-like domain-containing protein [Rhizophagus irregularis DAOM 181602=DAOM 197198]|eukprot:XP_025189518.1 kinase-like domain-containing protein [Rhizophagus irregularis DAOM 181602=DAOM 197198]
MNLGYQGSLDEPFQPQPVEVSEKKLGKRSFFNRRLSDQPRLIKDIIPKQVDRPTDNYGNIPWAEPVETNYYSTRNEPVDYPSSYYRTRNESVDHPANYYRTQNEFTKSDWQSTTVHNHPYTRYQKSQEIKPWDEGKTSDEILPKSENFSLELCIECQKPLSGMKWCRSCNAEHFHQQTSKWTSWRLGLDNVIIETQIAANNAHSLYEWIPFEDFDHITYLAKGGFGTVYKATWKRGPIIHWDPNIKNWTRFRNHEVILKIINGSQTNLDEFINQLTAHHKFSTIVGHLLRCFGISRWEDTGDFIIVTSCAKDGNLRQYMRKNSKRFTWIERLVTLKDIAKCLEIIHNTGYVHCDLHTGNILRHGSWTIISDLGLTWRQDSASMGEILGVLPFMPPEILYDGQYFSASDIYSFAMIMYEIASGEIPFNNSIQDIDPVFIIYGSRPGPPPATPPCYIELMKLCWDSNPKKRPTAGQLVRILDDWIHSKRKQLDIIYNSFQNAELELNYINYSKEPVDEKDYTHIDETYTSKLISIKDIVNRINQEKLQQKK